MARRASVRLCFGCSAKKKMQFRGTADERGENIVLEVLIISIHITAGPIEFSRGGMILRFPRTPVEIYIVQMISKI